MKTSPLAPAFFHALPRCLGAAAFLLTALVLAAPAAQAATGITKSLQGSYKFSSATIIVNGKNQSGNHKSSSAIKIGSTGLAEVPGSAIASILSKSTGGGSPSATITSSSGTALSATITGTVGSNDATVTNGTAKITLKSAGLTFKFSIIGVQGGSPINASITLVFKK